MSLKHTFKDNTHDFCILIESNFSVVYQVLSNPKVNERIFFKALYCNQKNKSSFNINININKPYYLNKGTFIKYFNILCY